MRPRVSVVVREKSKDFLLPASIKQHLDSFADFDIIVSDKLSALLGSMPPHSEDYKA